MELNSLSEARDNNKHLLQESGTRIRSLQAELDGITRTKSILVEQLCNANNAISKLTKCKFFLEQALPTLRSLKTEKNQCRAVIVEMTQFFTSSVEELKKWRDKHTAMHKVASSKLKSDAKVLEDEAQILAREVADSAERHAHDLEEAKASVASLEKKVKYIEETANNAALARTGERLSWEKAMEDMKAQHGKDQARLCCMSQDEQDILGTQIAELKDATKKQSEGHERKCQLVEVDWHHKMETKNAAISRIKYESALEIQGLSLRMAELSDLLAQKENECNSLMQSINCMREEQEVQRKETLAEIQSLSQRYKHEIEEFKCFHGEEIQQKNEEIERIERVHENVDANAQQRIDELDNRIISERLKRISELKNIKIQLDDLRSLTGMQIQNIKTEWESLCSNTLHSKLHRMK